MLVNKHLVKKSFVNFGTLLTLKLKHNFKKLYVNSVNIAVLLLIFEYYLFIMSVLLLLRYKISQKEILHLFAMIVLANWLQKLNFSHTCLLFIVFIRY